MEDHHLKVCVERWFAALKRGLSLLQTQTSSPNEELLPAVGGWYKMIDWGLPGESTSGSLHCSSSEVILRVFVWSASTVTGSELRLASAAEVSSSSAVRSALASVFVGYHRALFSCYFTSKTLEEGSVPPEFGAGWAACKQEGRCFIQEGSDKGGGGSVIMIAIGRARILQAASNATPCGASIGSSNRSSSLFPSRAERGCPRPSFQAGIRRKQHIDTPRGTFPAGTPAGGGGSGPGSGTPRTSLVPVEALGSVQRHQCQTSSYSWLLLLELETVKGTFSVLLPSYLMNSFLTADVHSCRHSGLKLMVQLQEHSSQSEMLLQTRREGQQWEEKPKGKTVKCGA